MYYLLSRSPHIAVADNLSASGIMQCAIEVSIRLKQLVLILFSVFYKTTNRFPSNYNNKYLLTLFFDSGRTWKLLTGITFFCQQRHHRLDPFQEKLFADLSIFKSTCLILKHSRVVDILYQYLCMFVQKFVSTYSGGITSRDAGGT